MYAEVWFDKKWGGKGESNQQKLLPTLACSQIFLVCFFLLTLHRIFRLYKQSLKDIAGVNTRATQTFSSPVVFMEPLI